MFRQSFNTGVDKEMPFAGRHSLKLSKYVIQDLINGENISIKHINV